MWPWRSMRDELGGHGQLRAYLETSAASARGGSGTTAAGQRDDRDQPDEIAR